MDAIEALILGLVQGLTEFLPVSSSGHLTIAQEMLGLETSNADNLLFDVIVHVATVLSTIVVFRKDLLEIFSGVFCPKDENGVLQMKVWNSDREYALKICISMIPIFVVGIFFKDAVEAIFGEGLMIVGCCLLVTACLLAFSYFAKPREKEEISRTDAFVVGLAQAVAVLPGLSRSGSTIATGLLLGCKKEQVARFSFLMVIVPILGEAALNVLKMLKGESIGEGIGAGACAAGFLAAFISGLLACTFMINIVKKGKLIYFAVYCAVAGAVALGYSMLN